MSSTPLADSQILHTVTGEFLSATINSTHVLFIAAQALFSGLVVMQLAWSAFKVVVKSDKIEDLQSEVLWQIIITSIFYFIVINCRIIIPKIINIFTQIAQATQPITAIDPTAVAAQGIQIGSAILGDFGVSGFLTDLPGGIITIVSTLAIAILFGLIAIDLMITLILSYFQIALAPLFIAFGTFEYVRDVGHSYIKSTLSLAIKLFVLYLVIGIGQSIASSWSAQAQQAASDGDIMPILAILVGALAFWRIAQVLPSHFASIIHSSHMGAGGFGSAMVGGAVGAATTAATIASGGTAIAAKAVSGAGAAGTATGTAIRTSAAAMKMTANMIAHPKESPKIFASGVKSGVSSLMQSSQNSSFIKNMNAARNNVRPPQSPSSGGASSKPSSPKTP